MSIRLQIKEIILQGGECGTKDNRRQRKYFASDSDLSGMNQEVQQLIERIKSMEIKLTCEAEGKIFILH